MTKHTEIPYKLERHMIGYDRGEWWILEGEHEINSTMHEVIAIASDALNARFIVKACNNHDRLVNVLKMIKVRIPTLNYSVDEYGTETIDSVVRNLLSELDKDGE